MHEFFEESLDLENTFEYILSIQVSLNGFSFSVLDPGESKVLAFKNTPLKISSNKLISRRFKEWFQSETILQRTFQKIRIIVFSEIFTLVPKNYHSNELKEEVIHILFKDGDRFKFAENLVKKIDATLLFALPEDFVETINETVGECEITHPVKSLIHHNLDQEDQIKLTLLFSNKDLYFILTDGSTVLLANNFKINHANDVVYFVLTALKQLGIESKSTVLDYAGKSGYIGETEKNLHKQFASIEKLMIRETRLPDHVVTENILHFL